MRPKESRRASLDQFLLTLRSHLLSLSSIQPQNPLVAARALSKNGVAVPFALPHPIQETKWTVAFEPPSDVHVVGSWANKISVKKKDSKYFGVDLSIEMPSVRVPELLSYKLLDLSCSLCSKRKITWMLDTFTSVLITSP